jgi:hypothetical protein
MDIQNEINTARFFTAIFDDNSGIMRHFTAWFISICKLNE